MAKKGVYTKASLISDVKKVTAYLADDEERHYKEADPSYKKKHIWLNIKRLKRWLKHAEERQGEVSSELYGIIYFQEGGYVTFIHNENGSIRTFTTLDAADAAANRIDENEPDQDNLKTRTVSLDGIGY
jgi:hypothetical protein